MYHLWFMLVTDIQEAKSMTASSSSPQQMAVRQDRDIELLWPFRNLYGDPDELRCHLEAQLPTRQEASTLTEIFLQDISWYIRPIPITREQIMEELIPAAYKKPLSGRQEDRMDVHDLALLFIVLAGGASQDLTISLADANEKAEKYYHLSRAALGLKSVFEDSSFAAIQTLSLMDHIEVVCLNKTITDLVWRSVSLASTIALHVCPTH